MFFTTAFYAHTQDVFLSKQDCKTLTKALKKDKRVQGRPRVHNIATGFCCVVTTSHDPRTWSGRRQIIEIVCDVAPLPLTSAMTDVETCLAESFIIA